MIDIEKIKLEIDTLLKEGKKIVGYLDFDSKKGTCKNYLGFAAEYEGWYTRALSIITCLLPSRLNDFVVLYSNPKRKEIDVSTYCIADALRGITNTSRTYGPFTANILVFRQVKMLGVCLENLNSTISNLQTILQADVFDSEIDSAKHLLKKGFLRAAGAICGVILEKHFAGVCKTHNIVISKKNPTIADYNDNLKDQVYDTIEWRRIQRLGDLRNLCDHNKDREPNKDEVEELISGTERVIKTIY